MGTTQIAAILKNESELRAAYATYCGNNPGNNKRARQGRYQEINEVLYKWYSLARESLVPINGPMLQEEAAEIGKQLAKPEYAEFKASSGWLEKWKNACGISRRSIIIIIIIIMGISAKQRLRCPTADSRPWQ